MKVTVTLNGGASNPWGQYGLRSNPFPQVPTAEYWVANRILASLDSDPIIDVEDLRHRLDGCSTELIEICVRNFNPGQRIRFDIEYPDAQDAAQ